MAATEKGTWNSMMGRNVVDFSTRPTPTKKGKFLTKTFYDLTKRGALEGDSDTFLETDNADVLAQEKYMKTWFKRETSNAIEGNANTYRYISRGRRVYIQIPNPENEFPDLQQRFRNRDCRRGPQDWPFCRDIGPHSKSYTRSCYNFPGTMNIWYAWKSDGIIRTVTEKWVKQEDPALHAEIVSYYENEPNKFHGYWFIWRKGFSGARDKAGCVSRIDLNDIALPEISSEFMQGHFKICIVASFASALYEYFRESEGKRAWVQKMIAKAYQRKWDMPVSTQEFVEMVNKCTRGYHLRRLENSEVGKNFIIKFNQEPFFSTCISLILRQNDGTTAHAVALYQGIVFDSSVKSCL
eukprot:scaffold10769_cov160-Amphora_coffeaeformis.AAC.1